jgi:glycosyltransferase involved in cell wall biosynthesis
MKSQSLVSIAVPVYNGENYLKLALKSIEQQTYSNIEILISDNGSTDQTASICEDFSRNNPRVKYFRQTQNIGAIDNFNFLVGVAQGEFFKWASHDDVCDPTYIQRCVEALESAPDSVLCHSDSDMINADGSSILEALPMNNQYVVFNERGERRWAGHPRMHHSHNRPSKRYAGVLLGTRWGVDSYGLFRLSVLKQSGLLPRVYGAEKVLLGEIAILGKLYQIPEILFKQRIHVESSGYKTDANSQSSFATAEKASPLASTRMTLLAAHFNVVRRAKLSTIEKFQCYIVLLHYLLQFKKWPRVFKSLLFRKGVGGEAREMMESNEQHEKRES